MQVGPRRPFARWQTNVGTAEGPPRFGARHHDCIGLLLPDERADGWISSTDLDGEVADPSSLPDIGDETLRRRIANNAPTKGCQSLLEVSIVETKLQPASSSKSEERQENS